MALDPAQPLSAAFTDAIAGAITTFLEDVSPRMCAIDASLTQATDLAAAFTAGGKRLRPAFCFWSRVAASGMPDDVDAVMRAAASLDLLHVGILVHDDVMDGSDSRRGVLAVHRQYEATHAGTGLGSSAAYGRAAAIQVGNLLQAWSVEMYERSGLPNADRARGRRYLDRMRTEVIGGQLLDIAAQGGLHADTPPIELAEHVVEFKTARYTIQRPAQLGAALGAGSDDLLSGLWRFGLPLGRAFQYRDDVLGVFGDEATTGKPSGDDLREGKRTVLVAEALAASATVATELESLLGTDLDDAGIDRARHLLTDSGALERTEARIATDYAAALEILDATPMTDDGRTALRQLAHACVERGV